MTKSEQNTLRKRNTAIKKRYERRYTRPFYLALREQKKAVIDAAKKDIHAAYVQISLISPDPLMKEYRRMYYKVVPHEADREYARLSTTKAFGVNIDWLSDITDFLNDYMLDNIVRPMTARTMERMYRSLNTGLSTGMSNDEIIKSLEDVDIDKVRARLIARTEATRAAEFASHLGANQHDFKVKRVWISAHDRRTRGAPTPEGVDDKSDHYHMNGMEVQEGELFIDPRNGAKYLYPGDSTNGAQAANVCNCRCSCGYEGVRDKDGNLVMKDSPKVPVNRIPRQSFSPVKDISEAETRILNAGVKQVNLKGLKHSEFNAVLKAIEKESQAGKLALDKLETYRSGSSAMALYSPSNNSISINITNVRKDKYSPVESYEEQLQKMEALRLDYRTNYLGDARYKQSTVYARINSLDNRIYDVKQKISYGETARQWTVSSNIEDRAESLQATVFHELGHYRQYKTIGEQAYFNFNKKGSVSEYGRTNSGEYFAEWYAHYRINGESGVPADLLALFKTIK